MSPNGCIGPRPNITCKSANPYRKTFEGYYVGTLRVEYVNWRRLVGQVAGIGAVIWLPPLFPNMLAVCFATTLGTASAAIWFTAKAIVECPPANSPEL
jgi:hypothetical protein